jgi:glycosyltransferase involved in cell wall biosynthesis
LCEALADENDALRQRARLDDIRLVRHVRGVLQGQLSGAVVPLLSLIVITRNEEASIERCLRSAAFADEVVVVDNHSADKTVEIARRLGAKVISAQDWPGFGPQKNRALDAATGDWVLSLDADEWIEQPLADEIKAAMRNPAAADGYEMPRRSRFCGKVVGHCGWWPDYVLRLWRRGRGRFVDAQVHERVKVDGRVSRFASPIEHEAIVDLADARDKSSRYAAAAAAELVSQGKRSSRTKALIRAGAAFVRTYVWRAGFLDGATGLQVARYNSDYTYQKWARVADATTRNS